jgi:hypothetical protein
MRKKIWWLAFVALCASGLWMALAPRIRVDLAARFHDPDEMKLHHVPLMHKSSGALPNQIQLGHIHLTDGGKVKFWYISGHVQPGSGLSRFDFQDGGTAYLRGAFCCEVWVSDEAVKDENTLLRFIAKMDGSPPG